MKSTLKASAIGFAFIGLIILSVQFQGCTILKSIFQTEPERVEMVLLTELTFHGEISGVKGPAIFGDFTVTHYINAFSVGELWLLEFTPIREEQTIFVLWAKDACPEGVALYTYNMKIEESTYWIYDSQGQAWQVEEEKYDYFLTLEHPCAIGMKPGIDAILSI